MRILSTLLLTLPALVLTAQTAKEAESFVKEAAAFARANGREALIGEVNKPTGRFNFATKKTLYLSIYDLDGKVIAHGAKVNVVGVNQINAKDANGKLYVKARVDLAKEKGSAWVTYMEIDPATRKEEPKTSYIERFEDLVLSCGIYQR